MYKKNVQFIEDFNTNKAEQEGYWLEVNHFADLTQDEMRMKLGFQKAQTSSGRNG